MRSSTSSFSSLPSGWQGTPLNGPRESRRIRENNGLAGTDNWTIVWWVVLLCAVFEYMDSAGGMGYGTALTPLLLTAGFDPKQVVPLVMITEMVTGLVSGLIHGEFENVEWKLRPMNETTKLTLLIAVTGMLATMISVTAVYNYFQLHKFWIKLYVTVLLVIMGICSIMTAVKYAKYRPNLMWIFAFVGGFNKGVGGGGYGPVITVGGLISGVPVKSMVAVTSFAEGMTCLAAVVTWFCPGERRRHRGLHAAAELCDRNGCGCGGGSLHDPGRTRDLLEVGGADLLLHPGRLLGVQDVSGYREATCRLAVFCATPSLSMVGPVTARAHTP